MEKQEQFPNSVHLSAENVKKGIKFYRDKLGFELRNCWPSEKKAVWASLALAGQIVMLGEFPTAEDMKQMGASKEAAERAKKDRKAFGKHPHGVGVHVYLQVPEVDAFYKACRKKRVTVVSPLETHFYGIRDFTIEDPEGYRIVFYSPVAGCEPDGEESPAAEAAPVA